jgi:2-C-methyl-D-erythritol 4-phosphate cytidylyltransferase
MSTPDPHPIPHAAAVVVAAGSSSRMGLGQGERKPFLQLAGRTVLEHACAALVGARGVRELVIVAREEDLSRIEAMAGETAAFANLRAVVPGGAARTDSVRAGVAATSEACELVAVHDAARPLLESEVVERALTQAARKGAALVAIPVSDTIKRSVEGRAALETVDRSQLWAAQTPQVFGRALLLELLERAAAEGYTPTDEAALHEHFVGPVPLVQGDATNIKLTTPDDLEIATALLEARARR